MPLQSSQTGLDPIDTAGEPLCAAFALHRSHLQCISWSQERDTWHVFMHVHFPFIFTFISFVGALKSPAAAGRVCEPSEEM